MRQSHLFTKTLKSVSAEETAINAQLLLRGGFVYKNSAGVYTYLPLGLRVINKISNIIREEMNALGATEVLMPALVENEYLQKTGRLEVDVGFDVVGKGEDKARYVLGWTHEEIITDIASKYVQSYKDLPFGVYQIQAKFRNEKRAKSGLLRGREFIMKDLYSFHTTEHDLFEYYEKVRHAYSKVFDRCGLTSYYTLADGGDFTISNTHEFQVIADAGEDTIFYCDKCKTAENQEVVEQEKQQCEACGGEIKKANSIEVGNIFPLGTKYAEKFGVMYKDQNDQQNTAYMGSYGIGVGRLMATIVEVSNDDNGIIWNKQVAPFQAHIVALGDQTTQQHAEVLYNDLQQKGIEALFDDRDLSPGEKLTDADLIGVPVRIVVSKKTQEQNGYGVKMRTEQNETIVSQNQLYNILEI